MRCYIEHMFSNTELKSLVNPHAVQWILRDKGFDLSRPITEVQDYDNDAVIYKQVSYHYNKDHWDLFKVQDLDHAPEWDGHKSEDVDRLTTLPHEFLETLSTFKNVEVARSCSECEYLIYDNGIPRCGLFDGVRLASVDEKHCIDSYKN